MTKIISHSVFPRDLSSNTLLYIANALPRITLSKQKWNAKLRGVGVGVLPFKTQILVTSKNRFVSRDQIFLKITKGLDLTENNLDCFLSVFTDLDLFLFLKKN